MQLKESFMFKKCCCCCCSCCSCFCCCCLAEKHKFYVKIHDSVLINRRYMRKNLGKLLTHSRVEITYIGFKAECSKSSTYSMILRKVTKYTPAYTEERSQLLIQTIEVSLTQFYSSTNSTGNVAMRRTANNPDFVQEYERGSETCHVTIAHLPLCSTNTILERGVDCHFFLLYPISSSRH